MVAPSMGTRPCTCEHCEDIADLKARVKDLERMYAQLDRRTIGLIKLGPQRRLNDNS